MPPIFTTLPVPSANGAGAAVDMLGFGGLKTCVVNHGTTNDDISITIELSNDAGGLFWAPLATVQGSGVVQLEVASRWMRAVASNYKRGTPQPVQVGGLDDETDVVNLPVPVGNGTGTAVDISTLPPFKTVQIGDSFRGNVLIEFSQDGVSYGEFASFQRPGYQSSVIAAQWARTRRVGVPVLAPGTPVANLAATVGGGIAPGDGNAQRFTYTVTGLEPDLTELTIPLPEPRDNTSYLVDPSQATCLVQLTMSVELSSRTVNQFVLSLSGAATAGDVFSFIVADPT